MAAEHRSNREAFEKGAGVAEMIVEEGPSKTIRNCRYITRFIADAVSNQGHSGIEFDEEAQEAVFRILHTVASALSHCERHLSKQVEVGHG